MSEHDRFLDQAIELASQNVDTGQGGPFGTLIVKDGQVIATGTNRVTSDNDPTAHGEIVAIRNACRDLQSFQLTGCILYSSCEPCPMCLSAIYWARLDAVYYASTALEAAAAGFDDETIYSEIRMPAAMRRLKMIHLASERGTVVFQKWMAEAGRIRY